MKPAEYDPTVVETPVEELNLTASSYNGLKREGVDDIGGLARMTEEELFGIRNFGKTNVEEIRLKLAEYEEDRR
ncbi:hypothetical protein BH24ACT22_BH24ACT22_13510 [soil metagenome]